MEPTNCRYYRKPSGKALVIVPGAEPPFLSSPSGGGTCVRKAGVLYCSGMNKQQQSPKRAQTEKVPRRKTPTFLLELPLEVNAGQAKRIRGHLEAGRQFYNALLSEGQRRLRRMRDDPAWQAARALPATRRHERAAAFRALREQYGFSEYALHAYAKRARQAWIADHLGAARRIRFKSRGRGLSSIENKRNDTGLRFVLQKPEEGNQGYLIWKDDRLAAKKVHETGGCGQHHHPRKAFLQGLAETVWAKRWTESPRHVCSTLEAHRGRARAASCSRVPTRSTKLSQFCHGCGKCLKKPLSQRWHQCACGVGPVQRDLYAAFLAAYLEPDHLTPSCAEVMSFPPEGAEARLRAAHEQVQQCANEGQSLPRSMGIPRAGARRPSSLSEVTPEPAFLFSQGRLEAWKRRSEPPLLEHGEFSVERYSKE
jgi:hypothetical protein